MADGLAAVFTYALPPVLGAVIGYVTNAIAIKMLFRPLREVRLFGIRLPFTPGIIPRRRGELAESIGRMVSRELLTEETLRKRLAEPGFMNGLKTQVGLFTDHALAAKIHSRRAAGYSDIVRVVEGTLRERLGGYLASPAFEELVRRIMGGFAEKFFSRTPAELLLKAGADETTVKEFLDGCFAAPYSRRLLGTLGDAFVRRVRGGASLETFFPAPSSLEGGIDALYPAAVGRLLRAAGSESARRELAFRGRFLLRDILGELNFVQRLIVSAAQYDRTLDEKMPKIIDDLLRSVEAALESETVRRGLVSAACAEILDLWKRPLESVARDLDIDVEAAVRSFTEYLAALPGTIGLSGRLGTAFFGFLRRHADLPLGEIVRTELGLPPEDAAEKASDFVVTLARRLAADRIAQAPSSIADAFLRSMESKTLGEILLLPPDKKERFDALLSEGIFSIVVKRLPDILRSFEVAALVTDRINELDVEEVERLLLAVIARHLTWINLFGALLGALIGGLQIFIGLMG